MECDVIRDLLPLYAEKIASPATNALVEQHLAECPDCRAQLEQMEQPLPVQPELQPEAPLENIRRTMRKKSIRTAAAAVLTALCAVVLVFWMGSAKAPVTVVAGDPAKSAAYIAAHAATEDGIICFDEYTSLFSGRAGTRPVMDLGPAGDKEEQARHIFDALRSFDHTQVSAIWAQCPDTEGIGLAIANRLNKAAGFQIIKV